MVTNFDLFPNLQCYIRIRYVPIDIVGIEALLVASFQNVAFPTNLTIMETSPFVSHERQSFFFCGGFYVGCCHFVRIGNR